jgi:hypothetical protein
VITRFPEEEINGEKTVKVTSEEDVKSCRKTVYKNILTQIALQVFLFHSRGENPPKNWLRLTPA